VISYVTMKKRAGERSAFVQVMVTPAELKVIDRVAEVHGWTRSTFMREAALFAAASLGERVDSVLTRLMEASGRKVR
jgi:uncharacterized protein (DUF1778 family)